MIRVKYRPTVAVIVTCFNREDTLLRALDSVVSQTYKNISLIVVDDASTDKSKDVIEEFKNKHNKMDINIVSNSSNKGQNASINLASRYLFSDLVCFLDSDDMYEPDFVNQLVKPFKNAEIDFAYCRLKNGPKWHLQGKNIYGLVLEQGYLSSLGTLMIRSKIFKSIIPLPERLFVNDMCQDDFICFKLSQRYSFAHVPMELYKIIGTTNSLTKKDKVNALGWLQLYTFFKNDILEFAGQDALKKHYKKTLFMAFQSFSFELIMKNLIEIKKTFSITSCINILLFTINKALWKIVIRFLELIKVG